MYEIFARLMESKGMSPYKVAKETGITQATLSRWKTGKVSPSIETLQILADYFKVTIDYLMGNTSYKTIAEVLAASGPNDPKSVAMAVGKALPFEAARSQQHFSQFVIDWKPIIEKVKSEMKNQSMTITDLAPMSGVSVDSLTRFLAHETELAPIELSAIGKVLSCNLIPLYLENTQKKVKPAPKDELNIGTLYAPTHCIPILGRVSAGLPLYAEQNIEGYTMTDLNGGQEYFALRVSGDSMNAARICDGDIIIVCKQDIVENGQIAVVMVNGDDATVKRFRRDGNTITLMPQSYNPEHAPQIYNLKDTPIRVIGKVVKVEYLIDN